MSAVRQYRSFIRPFCRAVAFAHLKPDQALRYSFVSTNSRCPNTSLAVKRPLQVRLSISISPAPRLRLHRPLATGNDIYPTQNGASTDVQAS
jgi:hypothetical protein